MPRLTLNSLIYAWAADGLRTGVEVDTFVAPGTQGWEQFAKDAERMVRGSGLRIGWPSLIRLRDTIYGCVMSPTCHLFTANQATFRLIQLAAQSDCPRLVHRILALNPQIEGLAVGCRDPVIGDWDTHAFRPAAGYSRPA